MTGRQKKLGIIAAGVSLLFFGALTVDKLFLAPLKGAKQEARSLRERWMTLQRQELRARLAYEQLKTLAVRTYDDTADDASAEVGERLTQHISASGLDGGRFGLIPTGVRRIRGAQEIGWSVQGAGPMKNVIDFFYLLQWDPYLHRVENIVLRPVNTPPEVAVHFRYLTLVFDPMPKIQRQPLEFTRTLASSDREAYDTIIRRDLFGPHVPPSPPAPRPPAPKITIARPGPESFRVVSLSQWGGEPEVHVRDLSARKTRIYHVGDSLAGGEIFAVDYRPGPSPKKPEIDSPSRVIIAAGLEYWAIESGDTLAEKHRLDATQLLPYLAARREE